MLGVDTLLVAAIAVWCALGALAICNVRAVVVLRPENSPRLLPGAPKVSILVPARNEEEVLRECLASLVGLDYPDFEIILVDDDSTDRTGEIAEEFVRHDAGGGRLTLIHNRVLPPGWRGKVHALSLAFERANGDWVLATDADVVFHPAALRAAVSMALEKNADLFSMIPQFVFGSFWEKAVFPTFSMLLGTLYPLFLVNRPGFPRAIAAGSFILMRREALEYLGGYERIRQTVVEDLRIAEMFKFGGRWIFVALSRGLLRTAMYKNARELWEGLARSAFEGSGESLVKILAGMVVGTVMAVLPWAVAVSLCLLDFRRGRPLLADSQLMLACLTCAVSSVVYLPVVVFLGISARYVFTLPLATLFYCAVSLHSAFSSLIGPGVLWKGRRYRSQR